MHSVKIIDRSMPFIALVPKTNFKVDGTHETKSQILLCMDFAQWNETAVRERKIETRMRIIARLAGVTSVAISIEIITQLSMYFTTFACWISIDETESTLSRGQTCELYSYINVT